MTDAQEEHLYQVKAAFVALLDRKYRNGQREHGGNMWEYPVGRLLDEAINEAVDQVVYLLTLKAKLSGKG